MRFKRDMFLQHGVSPETIGNSNITELLEVLNVPDDDPVFSFKQPKKSNSDVESFFDRDDIWADQ